MKQTEPKQKDVYEPPEVRDIEPVTIARGSAEGKSDPNDNGEWGGGTW